MKKEIPDDKDLGHLYDWIRNRSVLFNQKGNYVDVYGWSAILKYQEATGWKDTKPIRDYVDEHYDNKWKFIERWTQIIIMCMAILGPIILIPITLVKDRDIVVRTEYVRAPMSGIQSQMNLEVSPGEYSWTDYQTRKHTN